MDLFSKNLPSIYQNIIGNSKITHNLFLICINVANCDFSSDKYNQQVKNDIQESSYQLDLAQFKISYSLAGGSAFYELITP